MDYIKQLENLLETDVLLEIEESINELKYEIEKTKKNKDLKEELTYMQQVKVYFDEVVEDIKNNSITQEQAMDILDGLEDMRSENQEV